MKKNIENIKLDTLRLNENENNQLMYKYWGKADNDGNYHLLVYHCLDVAAVGKVWMEQSPGFVKRGSTASGISETAFVEWVLFFLALHDVGKFDVRFQNLCPDLREKLQNREKVDTTYKPRHDQRGLEFYNEFLFHHISTSFFADFTHCDLLREFFLLFAQVALGHHGIPPKSEDLQKVPEAITYYTNILHQLILSQESVESVTSLCKDEDLFDSIESSFKHFTWQLAGFTTICDWIASGDEAFVFCSDERDLQAYFSDAYKNATVAVNRAEIIPAVISKKQGMQHLFPKFANTPTPLQKYCNETLVTGAPQLHILEDVTGSGKTEAALTLASRILGAGGGRGCFVALPTMATSNAMYERMAKVYSKLYKDGSRPSLTLSHGSRHLSETFYKSYSDNLNTLPHESKVVDEDQDEGKAHCSQWLADSSKKALLADVGVGTIDQVLLAGLPVRYQSLRAFGMGQKVLIIDEVHAYDAYMLRLLENIITAQAAFRGSMILLSATIPFSVREKFCNAFSVGLGIDAEQLKQKDVFPLVTSVTEQGVHEKGVETRKSVAREVVVELCDSIDEIYELIEKSISDGKCICWIRNTISDVTASFEELQNRGVEKLDMFHSRFALNDRLTIEKRVLKRFGVNSTLDGRRCQVLVASQVVEQSLDLDFDVMISDLAPIDLLIQRAGRLHRHEREDRGKPVFYVHTPKDTNEPNAKWYAEAFTNARWVYRDVALLWLTKEILKKKKRLKMPEDARCLIESVYDRNYSKDDEMIPPEVFSYSEDEAWADTMNRKSLANFNRLKFEQGYCRMSNDMGKWESDERVSTRLSEPVNRIYLCRWIDGEIVPFYKDEKYSWDLSSLSLRKSALESVSYDEGIQNNIDDLKKLKRFEHDTLFLVFSEVEIDILGKDNYERDVVVRYSSDCGLIVQKDSSKKNIYI